MWRQMLAVSITTEHHRLNLVEDVLQRTTTGLGRNRGGAVGPVCYLGPLGKKILQIQDPEALEIRVLRFQPEEVSRTVLPYTTWHTQGTEVGHESCENSRGGRHPHPSTGNNGAE